MANILSGSKSNVKEVQKTLDHLADENGFNILYKEPQLCIDLPTMTTDTEEQFLHIVHTLQKLEKEAGEKYNIAHSFVREGTITYAPNVKLDLVIFDT